MGDLSITVIDAVVIGVILLSAGFALWARADPRDVLRSSNGLAGIYVAFAFYAGVPTVCCAASFLRLGSLISSCCSALF